MLDYDSVLQKVGEFGKFQIVQYLLIGSVVIATGWQNLASVFLAGEQRFRCRLYQFNTTVNESSNYSKVLYDEKCEVSQWDPINNSTHTPSPCLWDYDTSIFQSTIISQWDLICDGEWKVAFSTSIYMAGFLVGTIVFGTLSDRIGRLRTLVLMNLLQVVFGVSAACCSEYGPFYGYVILRFLVGSVSAGQITTAFVMVMEIIGPNWRMGPAIFVQGFFALGVMSLSGIAYFIRDHFYLQLCIALPVLLATFYYWLVPESARWLIAEGRYQDALPIVKRIAKSNGQPVQEIDLSKIKINLDDKSANVFDLIRTPNLRKTSLNVFFQWFSCSLGYYGLALGSGTLAGSIYINVFLSGLVEIPAYVACCLLLNRIGRRKMLCSSFLFGGAACLACIPVTGKDDLVPVLITLSMLGKCGISAAFATIYNYSAEVFPTVVRNAGVGAGSLHARIGSLLAPQIVPLSKFWGPLPSVIYGGVAVAAGLLSLLLPETLNKRLPETMQDGELFGTKAYNPVSQPTKDGPIELDSINTKL